MVEIFKTNIDCECMAQKVEKIVMENFQNISINFDLEDCDRILRVEGEIIPSTKISTTVQNMGLICEILD